MDSGTAGLLRDEDKDSGPTKTLAVFPSVGACRPKAQTTKELRRGTMESSVAGTRETWIEK